MDVPQLLNWTDIPMKKNIFSSFKGYNMQAVHVISTSIIFFCIVRISQNIFFSFKKTSADDYALRLYSVMKSDRNGFCVDVISDSNKASRDEDSILDQIYKSKICPYYYYDDFNSL